MVGGQKTIFKYTVYIFISILLLIILCSGLKAQTAEAQVAPSVRYLTIENKNESSFTVDWSVFTVAQWSDRMNFKLWIARGSNHFLVGSWGVGLSNHLYEQPSGEMSHPGFGIQGGYGETQQMSQITAECPFAVEQKTHPVDGLQTYYFYKTHLTFNFTFEDTDTLLLAADYKNQPELYEGGLPYYGPLNTGDYFRTLYSNIPNPTTSPTPTLTPISVPTSTQIPITNPTQTITQSTTITPTNPPPIATIIIPSPTAEPSATTEAEEPSETAQSNPSMISSQGPTILASQINSQNANQALTFTIAIAMVAVIAIVVFLMLKFWRKN
jgi:hypothetical protein